MEHFFFVFRTYSILATIYHCNFFVAVVAFTKYLLKFVTITLFFLSRIEMNAKMAMFLLKWNLIKDEIDPNKLCRTML